jgi:putative ABC transport system ATP-binding protein
VLQLHDVEKTFLMGDLRVEALRGVSFHIPQDQLMAIMGPSGSGKSTLLHLLGGLDVPTQGHVEIDGVDLTALSARKRAAFRSKKVGFVFQKRNLIPHLTAMQNVEVPMMLVGVARKEAHRRASALLEKMGLQHRLQHLPSKLSGGEQQRVAIARAWVNNPTILLADEPTGDLDTENGHDVLQLLRNFTGGGCTAVVVTHDPEVAEVADSFIRLRDGRLADDKPVTNSGGME